MNVFEWVEDLCEELDRNGQTDLAGKIWNFDRYIWDGRSDLAESIMPELLAASKNLGLPWLEIYIRHLFMAVRFERDQGEKALPEAVALFEKAHREENKGCPQAICATQDLVRCYARMDGPGYLEERQAVIAETMAKIDPSWNCFGCLTSEWSETLRDQNQHQAACQYLAEQRRKIERAGKEVTADLIADQALAASASGDHATALALMADSVAKAAEHSTNFQRDMAARQALVLARAGQLDAASETLPAFADILTATGSNRVWAETVCMLVEVGLYPNDADLGQAFATMLQRLEDGGSYHSGLELATMQIKLALKRQAYWSAQRGLQAYERMRAHLRHPARLAEQSAELQALLQAHPVPPMPVAADAILQFLRDCPEDNPNNDIERGLLWLREACAQRPDDADLHQTYATVLARQDAVQEADQVLFDFVCRNPEQEDAWFQLLNRRVDERNEAGVEQLIQASAHKLPNVHHYARARLAQIRGDYAACSQACRDFLAINPGEHNIRRLAASSARQAGMHAEAVSWLLDTLDADEEGDFWDLLTSAVILGDAELVQRCCQRLKLPVQPDTMPPIWDDGGYSRCVLLYRNSLGQDVYEMAERFGPVSARVVEVDPPNMPQRYGDVVVFDPLLLTPVPEEEEERAGWLPEYRHLHTQQEGGFTAWFVDGVYPGEELWWSLRDALVARGLGLWASSPSHYQVIDQENEAELEGVYGYVAAPKNWAPLAVAEVLTELMQSWPQSLCWLRLAEAAEHDVARHQAIAERFDL